MHIFVLQSGFVTLDASKLVRSESVSLSFKDQLYMDGRRPGDTENYYDEEVEKLFQLWHKDDSLIRRFEFRELILEAAIRLFAGRSKNMAEWINVQLSQRTVGFLHRRFLKECLVTALDNKAKTMDNYTYYRLLRAGGNDELTQTQRDSANSDLMMFIKNADDVSLTSILSRWTNDLRGFGDLLHSMHVIFGRRSDNSRTSSNTGVNP